jgi:predicted ester cyclase
MVYLTERIYLQVRFKITVIFACSDHTFIYITTSSIEGSIFHLPMSGQQVHFSYPISYHTDHYNNWSYT